MPETKPLYGAVEAGGTKWICAVGTGPDDLRDRARFPTTTPDETLGAVLEYFRDARDRHGPLQAVGVACFGPVDLDPASSTWGHVTATPKPGWAETDVAGPIARELGVPVGFDTDVNGAALAEARWGAGQGLDSLVYVTVGTGIGGGAVIHGRPVHGLVHPEMGHVPVQRRPDDTFAGRCPFHGDCFEGLASGPAIHERWGRPGEDLPPGHEAWDLQAFYLGALATTLTLTLSPQRLIFGGSVCKAPGLLGKARVALLDALAGYVRSPKLDHGAAGYLVAPGLGDDAGILGAVELARRAAP